MLKSVLIITFVICYFLFIYSSFLLSWKKIETDSSFQMKIVLADEFTFYLVVYKVKGGMNEGNGDRGIIYLTVLFIKTLKIQNKTKLIRT